MTPAKSIGPYRILGELGRGGTSVVFRAQHESHGLVALKVLSPIAAREPSLLARFVAEAQIVSSLDHPNVVQLLDVGQMAAPDYRHYLAFEYLDGLSLADILHALAGPLEVVTAVQIITHVARALRAAHTHDKKIVHRDIKPANIFVARLPRGGARVVVLDFGIAKLAQNAGLTQTGQGMGTPIYMAPEQALDASSVDHRADIYALATVGLEMLTGEPPPGNVEILGLISDELEASFRRARSHRPDRRWSSVSLFAQLVAGDLSIRTDELDDAERLGRLLTAARQAKLKRWMAEETVPLPPRAPLVSAQRPPTGEPHTTFDAHSSPPPIRPTSRNATEATKIAAGLFATAMAGALLVGVCARGEPEDEDEDEDEDD